MNKWLLVVVFSLFLSTACSSPYVTTAYDTVTETGVTYLKSKDPTGVVGKVIDSLADEPEVTPRCLRINNPGCVQRVQKQIWLGEVRPCRDTLHVCFENIIYGVRAQAMTLLTYQKEHGLKTTQAIIARYAEANTDNYANFVAEALYIKPHEEIDLTEYDTMEKFIVAQIAFENANYLIDYAAIQCGIIAAGVYPDGDS